MARFSTVFALTNSQADLDFVDIDLSTDTPLYLDPYAIQIRNDEWSSKCGDNIRSFFNELLDSLRAGNMARSIHLVSNLHEPNETFLGESQGNPNGKAVGQIKARQLLEAFVNSRAYETGLLSDVSEAELFIRGVGRDTISDLTTNVIRNLLAEYTGNCCALHNIPVQAVRSLGPVWDIVARDWRSQTLNLPVWNRRPILLVPKTSVRYRLSIDSQEFYNHHMVEFLQAEYLAAGGALVQVLKDGTPRVTKVSVKEVHPFIKDDLAAFVRDHPQVLEEYKNIKGAEGPLALDQLEQFFDERAFAEALIARLNAINTGPNTATEYHNLAMGICTFLFYPNLNCPIKEQEIHDGRKRIDIKFNNAATRGFFHAKIIAVQTRAMSIPIECKNYTKEIANPELDQIAGRFSVQRGLLGFLLCRNMDNRARFIQRCKDTARDGRGYIIVMEDLDIIQMLEFVRDGRRPAIDVFLTQRFDELTH